MKDISAKEAFDQLIALNPSITQADVREITGKPERTVSYWFAGGRTIDDMSLYLLLTAVKNARGTVPRIAPRYINRKMSKAIQWGKRNKTGRPMPKYVGEKMRNYTYGPVLTYLYHGALLTIRQIEEASGKSYHCCRKRIVTAELAPGDDVTDLVDKPARERKPKKIK